MEVEMFQNETCKAAKKASACRILNVGKLISYIFLSRSRWFLYRHWDNFIISIKKKVFSFIIAELFLYMSTFLGFLDNVACVSHSSQTKNFVYSCHFSHKGTLRAWCVCRRLDVNDAVVRTERAVKAALWRTGWLSCFAWCSYETQTRRPLTRAKLKWFSVVLVWILVPLECILCAWREFRDGKKNISHKNCWFSE